MASNDVVPPLSLAPGVQPSQKDDERCNILERNVNYSPIYNKIMQVMPSQQKTYTKIWPPANTNCDKHPMGDTVCQPNRPIYS